MSIHTYQEAVDCIERIGRFSVKNSNEHTRLCLARLGHPDRRFPQIHVAGTNGKGSTCAYLAEIMKESGRKTALFTSPHLVTIRERMQIDGVNISRERFLDIFRKVMKLCGSLTEEGLPAPSYFEFLFLMAELYFAEENVDIAIIETGLGGRLDATNSLGRPLLSLITSISFDHMQFLGTTISQIASEKAGIIKPGVPVIFDASREDAAEVIRAEAERKGCLSRALGPEDVTIVKIHASEAEGSIIDFSTSFRYDGRTRFSVRTAALYQPRNAALALLALKTLREREEDFADITAETVVKGLMKMSWPGRMEQLAPRVYLDGGHNVDGILRFTESARALAGGECAILLFAVASDKDYTDMIRILAEGMAWRCVIVTEVEGSRGTDPEGLVRLFRKNGIRNTMGIRGFREAYKEARERQKDGWLFVSGSLYLVGEIKSIEDRWTDA